MLLLTCRISAWRSIAEHAGQPRQLLEVARQFLRIDPHRIHRRADRERLAVAVGDIAAVRDDGGHAREARIALAAPGKP